MDTDDVDTGLVLLELTPLVRGAYNILSAVELDWTATYKLRDRLPKTGRTLSLRTRLNKATEEMRAASLTLLSIVNSLGGAVDPFPLPGERPRDDEPPQQDEPQGETR